LNGTLEDSLAKTDFYAILDELRALHDQKNKDYGRHDDPYANIRGSENWGIPAWKGAMLRANDKIKRLQKFAVDGELANESVTDSFLDLAVYTIIALDLYRGRPLHTWPASGELRVHQGDPGDETPEAHRDPYDIAKAIALGKAEYEKTKAPGGHYPYDRVRRVADDPH
jgi:hypothetical protein